MMDWLIEKWNGRPIQDCGPDKSREFKQFAADFRKVLRSFDGWTVKKFSIGHYNCVCFMQSAKTGNFMYISHDVPRYNQPLNMSARDAFGGILYRTCRNERDYHGDVNHFTDFRSLESDINDLDKGGF